jgi:hypothetical protein
MESDKSITYLALSDSHPGQCCSKVERRASFEYIEALASGLPMLSQRSYQIWSEQGIVVLTAAVIDRQYRWVVRENLPVTRLDSADNIENDRLLYHSPH